MNERQQRMARAAELAAQCQGEHEVDDREEGRCIFYCVLAMGHAGEHRDCKGRTWKRFPLFVGSFGRGPNAPSVRAKK